MCTSSSVWIDSTKQYLSKALWISRDYEGLMPLHLPNGYVAYVQIVELTN